MSRQLHKLTANQVKNATGTGTITKMGDGGGLTLVIKNNSKLWWFRYRYEGKAKTLSLGQYPQISLAAARTMSEEARSLLSKNIDPQQHKKSQATAQANESRNTFAAVATDWYQNKHQEEVTESHAIRNWRRLELYTFPSLGQKPMTEINATAVRLLLDKLVQKGTAETAHRVRSLISQVFRYAVVTDRAPSDVTRDLQGYLPASKVRHMPALVKKDEVAMLLKDIHAYQGFYATEAALKISPLLLARPGDIRSMQWEHIDFVESRWELETTKNGDPLIVPLPSQAMGIISEVEQISRHRSPYVFPNARDAKRPMTNNAIKAALDRMGYGGKMTAHGFRALARTLLQEEMGYPVHLIEMQLGHRVADMHGRAYNRTVFLKERTEMMQAWADYLEGLRMPG